MANTQLSIAKIKISRVIAYSSKPQAKKVSFSLQHKLVCTQVEHAEHHCTNAIRFHPHGSNSVKTEEIKSKHGTWPLLWETMQGRSGMEKSNYNWCLPRKGYLTPSLGLPPQRARCSALEHLKVLLLHMLSTHSTVTRQTALESFP